jgi:GIY-YIG catalytic domain
MLREIYAPVAPFLYPVIRPPYVQWGGYNDGSDPTRPSGVQPHYTVYTTQEGWYRVYKEYQIFIPRHSAGTNNSVSSLSIMGNNKFTSRLRSGLLNLIPLENRVYSTNTSSVMATLIKLTNAVKVYHNVELKRREILKDNKGQKGVYLWFNNLTNKFYVGSSKNLSNRFNSYLNPAFLNRTKNQNIIISKSLLKSGYTAFSLLILEYCEESFLTNRE